MATQKSTGYSQAEAWSRTLPSEAHCSLRQLPCPLPHSWVWEPETPSPIPHQSNVGRERRKVRERETEMQGIREHVGGGREQERDMAWQV